MIGILLVTHGEIGKSFIECSSHILGKSIDYLECIPIEPKTDTDICQNLIAKEIENLNQGCGVLILTDIYGATPSNLLTKFIIKDQVEVITGINLPMLIQAITERDTNLSILIKKCIKCAEESIKRVNYL